MKKFCSLVFAVGFAAALFSAPQAQAATFNFSDIDGAGQGPTFASQVTLDTIDTSGTAAGTIGFKITSAVLGGGDIFGLIEQVNFDDSIGLLGSFNSFVQTNAVDFKEDLKNLPQGNNVGFNSTQGFQAKPPPAGNNANSIRPGDMLTIIFALGNGTSLGDIDAALDSGALRLGMHVISFADGSSDTIVTTVSQVPLPAGILLLLTGIGGLAFVGRRRKALA